MPASGTQKKYLVNEVDDLLVSLLRSLKPELHSVCLEWDYKVIQAGKIKDVTNLKIAFKWFVIVSGVYDLLLGAALMAGASPGEAWLMNVTLGAFLLFAGAVLIWAARDLSGRGPVVFWQGLVRAVAATGCYYALGQGFIPTETVGAVQATAVIDMICFVIYASGLIILYNHSPLRLMIGRTN